MPAEQRAADSLAAEAWLETFPDAPEWQVWAAAPVLVVGFCLVSWRVLADQLFLGLAGRPWLYLAGLAAYLVVPWFVLGWLGLFPDADTGEKSAGGSPALPEPDGVIDNPSR